MLKRLKRALTRQQDAPARKVSMRPVPRSAGPSAPARAAAGGLAQARHATALAPQPPPTAGDAEDETKSPIPNPVAGRSSANTAQSTASAYPSAQYSFSDDNEVDSGDEDEDEDEYNIYGDDGSAPDADALLRLHSMLGEGGSMPQIPEGEAFDEDRDGEESDEAFDDETPTPSDEEESETESSEDGDENDFNAMYNGAGVHQGLRGQLHAAIRVGGADEFHRFEVALERHAERGLGLELGCQQEPPHHVWVDGVVPGSPAAEVGLLKHGDVLFAINGQEITGTHIKDCIHFLRAPKLNLVFLRPKPRLATARSRRLQRLAALRDMQGGAAVAGQGVGEGESADAAQLSEPSVPAVAPSGAATTGERTAKEGDLAASPADSSVGPTGSTSAAAANISDEAGAGVEALLKLVRENKDAKQCVRKLLNAAREQNTPGRGEPARSSEKASPSFLRAGAGHPHRHQRVTLSNPRWVPAGPPGQKSAAHTPDKRRHGKRSTRRTLEKPAQRMAPSSASSRPRIDAYFHSVLGTETCGVGSAGFGAGPQAGLSRWTRFLEQQQKASPARARESSRELAAQLAVALSTMVREREGVSGGANGVIAVSDMGIATPERAGAVDHVERIARLEALLASTAERGLQAEQRVTALQQQMNERSQKRGARSQRGAAPDGGKRLATTAPKLAARRRASTAATSITRPGVTTQARQPQYYSVNLDSPTVTPKLRQRGHARRLSGMGGHQIRPQQKLNQQEAVTSSAPPKLPQRQQVQTQPESEQERGSPPQVRLSSTTQPQPTASSSLTSTRADLNKGKQGDQMWRRRSPGHSFDELGLPSLQIVIEKVRGFDNLLSPFVEISLDSQVRQVSSLVPPEMQGMGAAENYARGARRTAAIAGSSEQQGEVVFNHTVTTFTVMSMFSSLVIGVKDVRKPRSTIAESKVPLQTCEASARKRGWFRTYHRNGTEAGEVLLSVLLREPRSS